MYISCKNSNVGKCPLWGVSVCVHGMYGKKDDGTWQFLYAQCPIVENSKLPIYEQPAKYKYMSCHDMNKCPLYTQFQPLITSVI